MDVLRRNTDYGLRAMAQLARCYGGRLVSTSELAREGHFSYQIARKILQKLHQGRLVRSHLGPRGGYVLSRKPSEITLGEIVSVLQGGIRLNRCLDGGKGCEFAPGCEVSAKLACLQLYIDGYLGGITLDEIAQSNRTIGKVNQV